jgi:tRNA(Ile)-lysidine synthase
VRTLPQNVLGYIRKHELLKAGDRVGVAVSGGADSLALLRLLLELRKEIGIVLSVVHFNHNLRGNESDGDERFVADLARQNKLELHCQGGEVAAYAAEKHLSLETAAREMRYQYFRKLLLDGRLNRIATAHTLDDQAETVLLKLVRGAGSRGLAGIYPRLRVTSSQLSTICSQAPSDIASIVRPLLGTKRRDVEAYLHVLQQSWREDKSNRDLRHTRNRVRHGILPRLERYLNPGVREALAETAEIARAEEEFWEREVARVLPAVWDVPARRRHASRRDASATLDAGAAHVLDLTSLSVLPLALQRRVVRAACVALGLRLEFHQVEEILALASNPAVSANLPRGWMVSRKQDQLRFEPPRDDASNLDYEYPLSVPGSVEVRETESLFEVVLVSGNAPEGYNPEDLLDRALLTSELKVRNWRAGDRFWPAHSKAPKKIKELLHVTGQERKLWPVVVSGTDVVWVRGLAAPTQWRSQRLDSGAVLIRELQKQDGNDFAE